jgi:hypothetical protein
MVSRYIAMFILSVAAVTAYADFKQQSVPARSFASAGDVAVGEIAVETADRLELNVKPCSPAPTIIVFRKPYLKDAVETVRCGDAGKPQVQVIQK